MRPKKHWVHSDVETYSKEWGSHREMDDFEIGLQKYMLNMEQLILTDGKEVFKES